MAYDQQRIQQWFQAIDTDRSNSLSADELQRALALGGLNFSITDVDQMVRTFDTTGRRQLGVQEFAQLHHFISQCQGSFYAFDRDNSKHLSPDELAQALQQAGFRLDKPALEAMISKYDPDNSRTLSLDEYLRACLFLQTASRTFGAFDQQRRDSITLNFNQFVYACSHVS